ncbi:MAG: hypothetical protein HOG89_02285 [Candidatus Peribacter sp.]|jgi:hypothetical protein|nr:hypothetical protein [Candidatus Peribacter sp.]MBT4392907.1 hypothetical protein [Candidatus Peribacter sp.]MBT4600967.1 hypothetical protein [Candidatus Peribacter sp.]MBT5148936.1 hypothetical protein [Candidatus Peribacter sp.]MBT5637996.1 hypothetical protein [Candidatus Peribacter sp.]
MNESDTNKDTEGDDEGYLNLEDFGGLADEDDLDLDEPDEQNPKTPVVEEDADLKQMLSDIDSISSNTADDDVLTFDFDDDEKEEDGVELNLDDDSWLLDDPLQDDEEVTDVSESELVIVDDEGDTSGDSLVLIDLDEPEEDFDDLSDDLRLVSAVETEDEHRESMQRDVERLFSKRGSDADREEARARGERLSEDLDPEHERVVISAMRDNFPILEDAISFSVDVQGNIATIFFEGDKSALNRYEDLDWPFDDEVPYQRFYKQNRDRYTMRPVAPVASASSSQQPPAGSGSSSKASSSSSGSSSSQPPTNFGGALTPPVIPPPAGPPAAQPPVPAPNAPRQGAKPKSASINPLPQAPKIASMRDHIGSGSMRAAGLNTLKGPVQAPAPPAPTAANPAAPASTPRNTPAAPAANGANPAKPAAKKAKTAEKPKKPAEKKKK